MKTLPVAAVLVVTTLMAGCSKESTPQKAAAEPQPVRKAEPQPVAQAKPGPVPKAEPQAPVSKQAAHRKDQSTSGKITKENFEKLRGDLSRADVVAILGEPSGIEPVGRLNGEDLKASVWHGEGIKILVVFGTDGNFRFKRMDEETNKPGTQRLYCEFGNDVSYTRNDVRMIGSPPQYGYRNVSGSVVLKNDKDEVVAAGGLQIVEGFIGLRAKKGGTFFYVPSQEKCSSPRWRQHAAPPPANLRYAKDQRWQIMDTNFFFLIEGYSEGLGLDFGGIASSDSSRVSGGGGLMLDVAASIARQSTIHLPSGTFRMFGYSIDASKNGATVKFSYGNVVSTVDCTAKQEEARQ